MTPLQKLSKHSTDDLTAFEAAQVLGLKRDVIYDLTGDGALECQAHAGRGHQAESKAARNGTRRKPRLSFTRLALLSYLVRCTRGDRAALMAEVEVLFPKWLPFAQRVAREADVQSRRNPSSTAAAAADGMAAAAPSNVIDIKTAKPRNAARETRTGGQHLEFAFVSDLSSQATA